MSEHFKKTYAFVEVIELADIDLPTLDLFIQREWVCPSAEDCLDQEDLARIELIQDIRQRFEANDEAVSLILHLMDQLYYLRAQLRKLT